MRPTPPIATYRFESGPVNVHMWLAEYVGLPMIFRGGSQDGVLEMARSWWETEQRKRGSPDAKREATPEQRANLAKARAARKREAAI